MTKANATAGNITAQEAVTKVILRKMAGTSFEAWCRYVLDQDGLAPARHHLYLIHKLQEICDHQDGRLMIMMPPGYGKSIYSSVLFPPYFISRHKTSQLIMGSAGLGLATDFSGKVQKLIREHGHVLGLTLGNDNKELWYTTSGARYKATGVGSDVAGTRSNLTLIDDPFGSFEDAQSAASRKKVYDWYRSDIVGRQLPGARIVIIMTRRHEDDLIGRLLDDGAQDWDIARLPEVAEENDLLDRQPGEILWPEFYTQKTVDMRRRSTGERDYATQYQQRPAPDGGGLFDVEKIGTAPGGGPGQRVRAWDLAATEAIGSRDPDYTAGVKIYQDGTTIIVEDVVRDRGGPQKIEELILTTAKEDGTDVVIYLPQDPGQAAKFQISYLVSKLAGYRIITTPATGSKAKRAYPIASQANIGNLKLVPGFWNRAFKDELTTFPDGSHDDQVDGLSDAYATLLSTSSGGQVSVQPLRY